MRGTQGEKMVESQAWYCGSPSCSLTWTCSFSFASHIVPWPSSSNHGTDTVLFHVLLTSLTCKYVHFQTTPLSRVRWYISPMKPMSYSANLLTLTQTQAIKPYTMVVTRDKELRQNNNWFVFKRKVPHLQPEYQYEKVLYANCKYMHLLVSN